MPAIHVVTDSACDLAPDMAAARGIRVVPLTIRFGQEELVDQVELTAKEFWDRVTAGGELPQTAAPSPGAFQQAFLDAAEQGATGVICINLSSGVSATYQSAVAAAAAVAGSIAVTVVDSRTLTMGTGLLVLAAADLADEGFDLPTIVVRIETMKLRTHVYGVIDTLDFLRRGGRIGGAAHLIGSMLSIKPVIEVRNGVVEVESKQRTRSRSLAYLAGKAGEATPLERLALVNGAAGDVDTVLAAVRQVPSRHELVVSDLGPVVGSHAGPGTIGLCLVQAEPGNSRLASSS